MGKINKKPGYFIGFCIVVIVVLATIFHFPVHITDALTLETATDFDIHISIWRILFEPILGLMLFFNRGIYAIDEMQFGLYWVLIIFIAYTLIKFIVAKNCKCNKTKRIFISYRTSNKSSISNFSKQTN